jgi:hypothetical protein
VDNVDSYEVEADDRGRVSLGKAGARPGRRYRVEADPGGLVKLTPVVSVPEREMDLLRDPDTQQRILAGVKQIKDHGGHDLGTFSHYLREGEA